MKPLYLEVTKDRYELPLAVADSAWELARLRHVGVTTILHATGERDRRRPKKSKYKIVWIDE